MPGGNADCLKCKHATDIKYDDKSMLFNKVKSLKCKARDQVMYKFKDFYCYYYEPNK